MANQKTSRSMVEKIEGAVLQEEKKVKKAVQHLNVSLEKSGLSEYVNYLSSPWRVFWLNLLAGTSRGLGFVLGATVVVAVIVYIIGRFLADLPVIGEFFDWVRITISNSIVPGTNQVDFGKFFQDFQNNILNIRVK